MGPLGSAMEPLGPPMGYTSNWAYFTHIIWGVPMGTWDVIREPFPSILGLFWAFGGQLAKPPGQLAKPPGQLAKPKGQLAKPKGQLAKPQAQLVHFGRFLGSLLGPCWDQFSALDSRGRPLPRILDHF